jgi:hypothetical protein
LPEVLGELTEITKKQTTKNDPDFKNLFRELKKKNATEINTLAEWIAYLKQNTYGSDMNKLRHFSERS